MSISLDKKVSLVKAITTRRKIPDGAVMQVKSCIDISGSMRGMFDRGVVQELVDRLLAVAVRFDDNQSIESYAFGSGAVMLEDIKPEHFGSYVTKKFLPQAGNSGHLWSGTNYAKALQLILNDGKADAPAPSGGFLSGLFGKKKEVAASVSAPTYLMFITDGDTSDESASEKMLAALGEQNTYVQLIGIGPGLNWLQKMGDKYDHVGFVTLPNLSTMTDEQLYEELLTEELATWITTR